MLKKILLLIVALSPILATSQEKKKIKEKFVYEDALPYYNFGKGVGITSPDSLFQLNTRFRMQNRLHIEDSQYEAKVRRLRLRFDGYVGAPQFMYTIQLAFSPEDVGTLKNGENLHVIRDAIVFYKPDNRWTFGFGQTKLPGNRQRNNSSGGLDLTDRSINNAEYNIDRDFGFQVFYSRQKEDAFGYNIKTALTTGEGRDFVGKTKGLAYTARLELYPLGKFKKNGEFFEGDLKREEKPRLYLGGTFHHNDKAVRSRGQQGGKLLQARDLTSVFLDAMLKYDGWAFMSAYMSRSTDNPLINVSEKNYVQAGNGYDAQLSYVFPSNWEFIGRFSHNTPHKDIRAFAPKHNQFSFGVTKYIWEHAFKIQFEVTKNDYINTSKKDDWYARFQIEIGI
ncbi:porin [Capnocytophaga canimorsus]|uniref:porin n=1 Tax=Capnocytophaga canimorsus TaxID=28188 RepID=UPI00385F4BF5